MHRTNKHLPEIRWSVDKPFDVRCRVTENIKCWITRMLSDVSKFNAAYMTISELMWCNPRMKENACRFVYNPIQSTASGRFFQNKTPRQVSLAKRCFWSRGGRIFSKSNRNTRKLHKTTCLNELHLGWLWYASDMKKQQSAAKKNTHIK